MMIRTALALGVAAVGLTLAAPQPAHAQAHDKVMIIYGNDKCPTSSGEEIVVCRRVPESDRYRIPKELRDERSEGRSASWADRVSSMEYVGKTGTQSCSPVGAGGYSGCLNKLVKQAREEDRAKGETPALHF